MSHEQLDLVPKYFDGELDPGDAAAMERHLQGCAECAVQLDELRRMREAMRTQLTYFRTSAGARAALDEALDRETSPPRPFDRESSPARRADGRDAGHTARGVRRPFWWGALSGGLAMAAACGVAFLLAVNSGRDHMIADLTDAHLRSLLPNRLLDVESTDQHTVKPWFAGHSDVSPPAVDFASRGYSLIGGRIDYVSGHRAAVLVYRHGAHIANVFVWADDGAFLPGLTTERGYHTACWHGGRSGQEGHEGEGLAFCAVSDMASGELSTLERLMRE